LGEGREGGREGETLTFEGHGNENGDRGVKTGL